MAYTFRNSSGSAGKTTKEIVDGPDGKQIAIVMSIASNNNAIHEITHAWQGGIEDSIEIRGSGIIFRGPGALGPLINNSNVEIEAYKAQYAFDPSSMPSSTMAPTPQSINAINAYYVGGINDNADPPQPVYPNVRNLAIFFKLLRISN